MMDPERIAALRERIASLAPAQRELLRERLVGQGIDPAWLEPDEPVAPTPAVERPARLPLSAAQSRVWVLHQIIPGLTAYHIPFAWSLRGALDEAALDRAFAALVARHESLRTVFPSGEDGRPVQDVRADLVVPLEWEDVPDHADRSIGTEGLPEWVRARAGALADLAFDLAQGPLLRIVPMRVAEDHVIVVVVLHHLVADGWSRGLFMTELAAFYRAACADEDLGAVLPPLAWHYVDHVLAERAFRESDAARAELAYWKERLAGLEPLELQTGRARPAETGFRSRTFITTLPPALNESLKTLARQSGLTYFMFLLAAFKLLLHRYTGASDLAVGVPVGGRTDPRTLSLVGFFVNTLVVRTRFAHAPNAPVVDWFAAVKDSVVGALEHQRVPFADVVDACAPPRQGSRNPFFEIMFQAQTDGYRTQNAAAPDVALGDLAISQHAVPMDQTKFDMSWHLLDRDDGLLVAIEYRDALFDDVYAGAMAGHFRRLLEALVATPDARLAELSPLAASERERLVGFARGAAAPAPAHATLPAMLEHQAALEPAALAVQDAEGARLTYAQLEARSRAVAQGLVAQGIAPEDRIGVRLPRRVDLLVAMLGVLRAGAAFVPLDPSLPEARLRFMAEDAGCRRVIGDAPGDATSVEALEDAGRANGAALPALYPQQLAYVMYTSGSSGRPKGTMIPHAGLSAYLEWCRRRYPVTEGYGAPVHGSIGFDATLTALFAPLACGATVQLLSDADDLAALAGELAHPSHGPSGIVKLTPAHLKALPPLLGEGLDPEQAPRAFVIGGEALTAAHVEAWRRDAPAVALLNEYGPTETVVGCCVHEVGADETGNLPIGRPIDGVALYVLDHWLEPCPVGVPGELYIGGPGVARGYLDRPRLSAERFVPNPFRRAGDAESEALYRTGDQVAWRDDGVLLYLGRLDEQVQLNGYRIELAEVEARLLAHPDVEAGAVVVQTPAGQPQLVAFFSTAGDPQAVADALPGWLAETLPAPMRPHRIEALDAVPLTPNGKVDRKALPEVTTRAAGASRAPETDVETRLVRCWCEALGRDAVGLDDNLFELGGDSITGMQIIGLAREAGLHLTPRQLFEHQTVAGQARVARSLDAHETLGLTLPDGPFPLSPIQWAFLERLRGAPDADRDHENHGVLLRLTRPLDRARLDRALSSVVAHHDSLRLRLVDETPPLQTYVAPAEGAPIVETVDLSAGAFDPVRLDARLAEAQRDFDLATGRVFRAVHVAMPEGEADRLLLLAHHWAVDAWSMKLIVEDLERAYAQLERGEDVALPPKTSSFASWVAHLDESLEGIEAAQRHWVDVCRPVAALPWGATSAPDAVGHEEVVVTLDPERTRAVLASREAQGRNGVDAVLAATLGHALCRWADVEEVVIDVEGHGRHAFDPGLDLMRTTGWFTSRHPVRLRVPRGAEASPVAEARAQIADAPHQGLSFGLLAQRARAGVRSPAELQLNYLGRMELDRMGLGGPQDAPFARLEVRPLPALRAAGNPTGVRVEVVGLVEEERLTLRWRFRSADVGRATVERIAERHAAMLHSKSLRGDAAPVAPELDAKGVDRGSLEKLLSRVGSR
ncbi:MAG: amino acid adenylation domain-containing protein [Myxococcota bacterium]